MAAGELSPPSQLLRASAVRWLEGQGVASAPDHLRIPLDLRYGDVLLPAHLLGHSPATDNRQPTTDEPFTAEHDNAGNLRLLLRPLHAATLLESAAPWLAAQGGEYPLSVEEEMSDEVAQAILRVAGLVQHCAGATQPHPNTPPYTLLAVRPNAHSTMRLLLRADRITAETRALYSRQLAESIGTIYHRERILLAAAQERDAWLRLLVAACRTLHL